MKLSCCNIKSGSLRDFVVIQAPTASRKSGGGQTVSWSTFASVYAWITPKNKNEYLRAMNLDAQTTHKIIIRYNSSITTKMRIKLGSRYFNIQSIIDVDEAHKWSQIDAIETNEAAA